MNTIKNFNLKNKLIELGKKLSQDFFWIKQDLILFRDTFLDSLDTKAY